MLYRKPPLQEAVCELHFGPEAQWDSTTAGVLYTRYRERYPVKRAALTVGFAFGPGGVEPPMSSERSQFWAEGDTALVQVDRAQLVVNRLRPYGSWQAFRDQIRHALETYTEVTGAATVVRVVLLYLNVVEVPVESLGSNNPLRLHEYFRFRPELEAFGVPAGRATAAASFFEGEAEAGTLAEYAVQIASLPTPGGSVPFQLSLTASPAQPISTPLEGLWPWLERAHERIEDFFERSITERTRALFEPLDTPHA